MFEELNRRARELVDRRLPQETPPRGMVVFVSAVSADRHDQRMSDRGGGAGQFARMPGAL